MRCKSGWRAVTTRRRLAAHDGFGGHPLLLRLHEEELAGPNVPDVHFAGVSRGHPAVHARHPVPHEQKHAHNLDERDQGWADADVSLDAGANAAVRLAAEHQSVNAQQLEQSQELEKLHQAQDAEQSDRLEERVGEMHSDVALMREQLTRLCNMLEAKGAGPGSSTAGWCNTPLIA